MTMGDQKRARAFVRILRDAAHEAPCFEARHQFVGEIGAQKRVALRLLTFRTQRDAALQVGEKLAGPITFGG